uniref:Uncharacterized protein n=1 Tax=Euplotes crassus TaxID=5936 RepID=A0A7S3NZ06_EUPCR|mmetsp:Transcript_3470/g.3218  ORF Transcript_3470/g.3218 Transcript_3470/m.3218 type:complete len:145 (+) Transcript_3470:141-575(+)
MTEEEFMVMKQNLKDIDVRKNQLEALRKIVAMWKKNIMRRNSIQDYVEKARSKFKQVLTKNKVINQFKLALDKSEKKKAENPGNNLKPRRYSLKKRSSNKEERRDSIFSIDSQKSEYMDSVAGFSQIGFKGYSIDFLRKRFGLS